MIENVEVFVSSNIEKGVYPGSQVLIAHHEEVIVDLALGSMVRGSDSSSDRVRENTLFNLESITKVMVTLPLAFKLVEEGQLCFDDRVADFIEDFGTNEDKKKITIRDLLNFTSGIPLDDPAGSEEAAFHGDLEKTWKLHYVPCQIADLCRFYKHAIMTTTFKSAQRGW